MAMKVIPFRQVRVYTKHILHTPQIFAISLNNVYNGKLSTKVEDCSDYEIDEKACQHQGRHHLKEGNQLFWHIFFLHIEIQLE